MKRTRPSSCIKRMNSSIYEPVLVGLEKIWSWKISLRKTTPCDAQPFSRLLPGWNRRVVRRLEPKVLKNGHVLCAVVFFFFCCPLWLIDWLCSGQPAARPQRSNEIVLFVPSKTTRVEAKQDSTRASCSPPPSLQANQLQEKNGKQNRRQGAFLECNWH